MNSPVQKKKTASAYEAICQSLGVPQDSLTLSVIDMIDAAKYQDYGVDWSRLLDFNLAEIKKSENKSPFLDEIFVTLRPFRESTSKQKDKQSL